MSTPRDRLSFSPWWLVVAGAVAMGVAGFYQFLWSSIRDPLGARLGAPEATVGTIFTLFIVFQTVSQFPFGWVRDRYGPRWPLLAGAVLLAAGFVLTAVAGSLVPTFLAFCLGGIGAGATYTVAINTTVKWFDERRGLATGFVSMSYSVASFAAIPFVREGATTDFRATLLVLGAVAGVGVLIAVPVLRDPTDATVPTGGGPDRSTRDDPPTGAEDAFAADERAYTWRETLRTWQFWLLYGVFVLANGVSLMIIGKAVSFAGHLGLPTAVATGSASLIALGDATGILAGGAVSDRVGGKYTVGLSLVCFGLALALAVAAGAFGFDVAFVVLLAVSVFFRSPMFSVFPALVGEYYGRTHSSTNYALLYTGKLWGGIGAGVVASLLITAVGWNATFLGGAGIAVVAGVATLFLRPVGG